MKNITIKIGLLVLSNLIAFTAFAQYNNAFKFKITGNNYSDETVIRMLNGASQNFDAPYDAWKLFSPNPNAPSIYTNDLAGQELSINSLPEFTEDISITIYTNIPVAGTYTIDFEEIYALAPNYKISLTNTNTNSHYRLIGDTALTFTFNPQQNSPSFTFNISTPPIYAETNESCNGMNDGLININNPGNSDWVAEIINVNQSIVASSLLNTDSICFQNLLPGDYSVSVNSKGIIDEFYFTIYPAPSLIANFNMNTDTIFLSKGGDVDLTNISQNAQSYSWEFGDGGSSTNNNLTYTYSTVGNFDITLLALNSDCTSDTTKQITVLQSPDISTSINVLNKDNINLSNLGNFNYKINTSENSTKQLLIYDIKGSLMFEDEFKNDSYTFSLSQYNSGIYIVNILNSENESFQEKLYR